MAEFISVSDFVQDEAWAYANNSKANAVGSAIAGGLSTAVYNLSNPDKDRIPYPSPQIPIEF